MFFKAECLYLKKTIKIFLKGMKVKKIIFTLFVLFVFAGTYWYYSWNKAQKEALKWVEDRGIQTEAGSNPLIDKLPDNLKFLEKYFGKEIKKLDLSPGNRVIEDDDPFDGLSYPAERKLEPITDISILQRFSSLKDLSLNRTEVADISVLRHLKDLETLDLSYTCIKDLNVLKSLSKLKQLDLSGAYISDINVLSDLRSLEELYLTDTSFNELPGLGRLVNLRILSLRNTPVKNISALKELPKLSKLNLAHSDVTSLSPLFNLKSLSEINLKVTPLNHRQIKELQKHLPACHIRYKLLNYKDIDEYINAKFPRFKCSDNSLTQVFRQLQEESIRADPEYATPLTFRTKDYAPISLSDDLSMDLEDLTIGEIIHIICKHKRLHYKLEKHAVIVYHPSALTAEELAEGKINLSEKKIQLNEKNSKVDKQFKIIIPKVRFEDRDTDFVVDFIKRTSRDLSEDNSGLNILSMINTNKKINLDRDNISVKEVIDEICKQVNISYHIEANTIILSAD